MTTQQKSILTPEQMEELKEIYHKYFKNSLLSIRSPHFDDLKEKYLYINFYLAADKKEVYNGYFENDMFSLSFELIKTSSTTFTLISRDSSYLIKPVFDTFMAYNRVKVPFRKTSGDFKKIISTLEKHLKKFNNSLKESLKNNYICNDDKIDFNYNNVSHLYILNKHLI